MDDLPRVVAAGAGEHGHPAVDFVHEDLDHAHPLLEGESRILTCRAAGHEKVDAGINLPASEPAHRLLVELA